MSSSSSFEDTAEAVELAQAGDRAALGQLLERYRAHVTRVVGLELGFPRAGFEIREDVVQEAFVSAINGLPRFTHRGEGSFRAWLTRVTKSTVLDHIRRQRAGKRAIDRERPIVSETGTGGGHGRLADHRAHTPSALASSTELRERMNSALMELSEGDRNVILLGRFHGCTFGEIAEQMSLASEGAARAKLSRALARLSMQMDQ